MQINGIGSNQAPNMQQTTTHMYNQEAFDKNNSATMPEKKTTSTQQILTEQISEEGFSLTDWLKNLLGGARGLIDRIWNGEEEKQTAQDAEVVLKSEEILTETGKIMAESGVEETVEPEKLTTTEKEPEQPWWRKLVTSLENITAYLTGTPFAFGKSFSKDIKESTAELTSMQQKKSKDSAGTYQPPDMGNARALRDEKYFTTTYNKKGQYTSFAPAPSEESRFINKDL